MKKRYLFLLLLALSGSAVIAYNFWSYSCGLCNAESLMTLSLPAQVLILIDLAGLLAWALVHLLRRRAKVSHHCGCGEKLLRRWQFCPGCGQARLNCPSV